MSSYIAIFERFSQPADSFGLAKGEWLEVAREWASIAPVALFAQRTEFVDAAQTKGTRKSIAEVTWSPTLATVDSSCRMKVKKNNTVDESEPDSDVNFRIFEIDQLVNVGEANRELQFMVVEKV